MIEPIRQSGGLAIEAGDRRRGRPWRRVAPWRGITQVVAREGVEVADALAVAAFTVDPPERGFDADDAPVSAAGVARRLRGAAATAIAAQARLGAAAVIRLVDPRG